MPRFNRLGGATTITIQRKVPVFRVSVTVWRAEDWYEAEMTKWYASDAGQFIVKNAVKIEIQSHEHRTIFCHKEYVVTADIEQNKLVEFYLKWGNDEYNAAQ